MDNVVLNKSASIERCIQRIQKEYAACQGKLDQDILRQESILLNLQRACELSTDLALHVVRTHQLGLPNESREVFELLGKNGLISFDLQTHLQKMVAFRNIAVHEYVRIDLAIVKSIIENHLSDFLALTNALITQS